MHRDLLDALCCPANHEPSWLVAMVQDMRGQELWTAELSCPVCGAIYAIAHGVAHFGAPPTDMDGVDAVVEAGAEAIVDARVDARVPDATRVAALLAGATTAGPWPVLVTGAYTRVGMAVAQLLDAPQVWLDAPSDTRLPATPGAPPVSRLVGGISLPLRRHTLAAAAVDTPHATPATLARVVEAIRPGGHLLVPATQPLPAGVRLLARDDAEWVAETLPSAVQDSGLVELRRRPGA